MNKKNKLALALIFGLMLIANAGCGSSENKNQDHSNMQNMDHSNMKDMDHSGMKVDDQTKK